ncbi:hypothetical protein LOC67_20855 [Stieleria sp. JC731]|uniref:hypothetical protein n=1 Tax=Pirellulaceae TaxID=2691357 RepID=UPI001E6265DE|nr:hypothetical protein [Stieleria sp. JC731]MCC9603005.1 hypothetical protein [Stieleria sp. JC731]
MKLIAAEWKGGEIEALCSDCGTEYVVNSAGAGAQLPCRCGGLITIPTMRLVDWQPSAPVATPAHVGSSAITDVDNDARSPEPVLAAEAEKSSATIRETVTESNIDDMASAEVAAADEDMTPEPIETDSTELACQQPPKPVLPIVASPTLFTITTASVSQRIAKDPVAETSNSCNALEDVAPSSSTCLRIDASLPIAPKLELIQLELPSRSQTSTQASRTAASVRLPITTFGPLFQIQPPDTAASLALELRADTARLPIVASPELFSIEHPTRGDARTKCLDLPIVAAPELYQIQWNELPRQIDETVVRLPIVAAPTLHEIELSPEEPTEQRSTEQRSIKPLPIVAAPELFQIETPVPRPIPAYTQQLPIIAAPELYSIEVVETVDEPTEDFEDNDLAVDNLVLPVVRSPELFQIEFNAESVVSEVNDATADVTSTTAQSIELPITAVPTVYQISLVDLPQVTATDSQPPQTEPAATEHSVAEEQLAATAKLADDHFELACPGCKATYPMPRDAIGESAECECGFVFQIKDNVDAIDDALAFDLVPFPPLVADRTGHRATAAEDSTSPEMAARKNATDPLISPKVEPAEIERQRSRSIDRMSTTSLLMRYAASTLAVIPIATLLYWFVAQQNPTTLSWQTLQNAFRSQGSTAPLPTLVEQPEIASADQLQPLVTPPAIAMEAANTPNVNLASAESDQAIDVAASSNRAVEPESIDPQDQLSEFLRPVQQIAIELRKPQRLDRASLQRFANAIESLRPRHRELTQHDLTWLGESWRSLAERAESADLASRCFYQASSAYSLLLTIEQTEVSKAFAEEQQRMLYDRSREAQRIALLQSGHELR